MYLQLLLGSNILYLMSLISPYFPFGFSILYALLFNVFLNHSQRRQRDSQRGLTTANNNNNIRKTNKSSLEMELLLGSKILYLMPLISTYFPFRFSILYVLLFDVFLNHSKRRQKDSESKGTNNSKQQQQHTEDEQV